MELQYTRMDSEKWNSKPTLKNGGNSKVKSNSPFSLQVSEDSDDFTQGLTQAVNESLSFEKNMSGNKFPEEGSLYSESASKVRSNSVVITKRLKPSDSSFGLHADDEMNGTMIQDNTNESKLKVMQLVISQHSIQNILFHACV